MSNIVLKAIDIATVKVDATEYARRGAVVVFDDGGETISFTDKDGNDIFTAAGISTLRVDTGSIPVAFLSYAEAKTWTLKNMVFTGNTFVVENNGCIWINDYPYGRGMLYPVWDNHKDVQKDCITVRNSPHDYQNILGNARYDTIFADDETAPFANYNQLKKYVADNFFRTAIINEEAP